MLVAGLASIISLMKRIYQQRDQLLDDMDENENDNIVICNMAVVTPRK